MEVAELNKKEKVITLGEFSADEMATLEREAREFPSSDEYKQTLVDFHDDVDKFGVESAIFVQPNEESDELCDEQDPKDNNVQQEDPTATPVSPSRPNTRLQAKMKAAVQHASSASSASPASSPGPRTRLQAKKDAPPPADPSPKLLHLTAYSKDGSKKRPISPVLGPITEAPKPTKRHRGGRQSKSIHTPPFVYETVTITVDPPKIFPLQRYYEARQEKKQQAQPEGGGTCKAEKQKRGRPKVIRPNCSWRELTEEQINELCQTTEGRDILHGFENFMKKELRASDPATNNIKAISDPGPIILGANGRQFEHFPVKDKEHAKIIGKLPNGQKIILAHRVPPSPALQGHIKTLATSTEKLVVAGLFSGAHGSHVRGDYIVIHIAKWKKYAKLPFLSAEACAKKGKKRIPNVMDPLVKEWLEENQGLWKYIAHLVKTYFPNSFKLMDEAARWGDEKGFKFLCGLFAGVAINIDVQTLSHKDCGDLPWGLCCVICWGKFTGGQIVLDELEAYFDFPGGYVMFFRSAMLTHSNMKYATSWRRSIVLFNCKFLMSYFAK
ncbi:hypothetical protein HDV00_011514 [Rhizophlyctis rosea]|nr:hypothetical protein HDV00_011514 [Rhizophlyctis rosea]